MSDFMAMENIKQSQVKSLLLKFVDEDVMDKICFKDYYDLKEKN